MPTMPTDTTLWADSEIISFAKHCGGRITKLSMDRCTFTAAGDVIPFVGMFPSLKELSMEECRWRRTGHLDQLQMRMPPPLPPSLDSLEVVCNASEALLASWLSLAPNHKIPVLTWSCIPSHKRAVDCSSALMQNIGAELRSADFRVGFVCVMDEGM